MKLIHCCLIGIYVWTSATSLVAEEITHTSSASKTSLVSTLEEAQRRTLELNPQIQSLGYDVQAREDLIQQADLIPNPELDLTGEQLSQSKDGNSYSQGEVRISQRIERGGKRGARVALASVDKERTELESQLAVVEILGEVKKSWARLKYLTAEKDLRDEQLGASKKLVSAVGNRVEAGATLPAELSKARTTVENDTIELRRIEQELNIERQLIASFWGGEPEDVNYIRGASDNRIQPTYPLIDGLQNSLQLRLVNLQTLAAEKSLAVETAKGYQDVTLSAGYQRLNGFDDDAGLVALSVPLPFSDRNQGAIASATRGVQSAKFKAGNQKLKLEARLRSLSSTLRTLDFESSQLRNVVIPQASKTFSELQNAFTLGKASFLDVVDSQRTLLSARSRSLDVERAILEAQAEIEVITADKPTTLTK